ncbi:MAG: ATP-dependent DNA helicase RecG, partial [Anaerovoracaceae bacterium]|nr:ATP-dependent DNA helicase RecG [Anaerovoracaceae bacterium]
KTALMEKLNDAGIDTVEDLLLTFPRGYEDRTEPAAISSLTPGESAYTAGIVTKIYKTQGRMRGRKSLLKLRVEDVTGSMEVLFFNAAFLAKNFVSGEAYVFYGRVTENSGAVQMIHPEFEKMENASGGIFPVYRQIAGISQRDMRKSMRAAIQFAFELPDILPREITDKYGLCDEASAVRGIHFPKDRSELESAKRRAVYEQMFVLRLGLLMMQSGEEDGISFPRDGSEYDFAASLPYALTGAQRRAIREIYADMERPARMNRLLQGDVGSGKTAAAEAAMYKAFRAGYQSAFMAPTELLAKQHYETLRRDLGGLGMDIGLLTGHMKPSEKEELCSALERGDIDAAVGTHALIQPDVSFRKLGLVVTDEQHRFGVDQRAKLGEKGAGPDMLVMTATPIPRSLAVIMYGDRDVSVLDEMPPGRVPVQTKAVTDRSRKIVYDFIMGEAAKGRQGYIVAPLIEDSSDIDARSACGIYDELRKKYPGVSIALLHGRMKEDEKNSIMQDFAEGRYSVLVSTVVIEVGIDVANATFMVIESAERFGLAQMHQLRGRVGRGSAQSYCVLIMNGTGDVARSRAHTLVSSSDGFYIAEKDLELRGPGEVFGTRQHGVPDVALTEMVRHTDIMEELRGDAMELIRRDPDLSMPGHTELRERVETLFGGRAQINI